MDTKKIKLIMDLFEESKISSMDLEVDDIKIKLEKAAPQLVMPPVMSAPVAQAAPVTTTPVAPVADVDDNAFLKSPLVGTYYASSTQGGTPFVRVGSRVNEGDVVCIIEAMKVMNEVKAHRSGVVSEVKVNDGDMVQFDEALIAIKE